MTNRQLHSDCNDASLCVICEKCIGLWVNLSLFRVFIIFILLSEQNRTQQRININVCCGEIYTNRDIFLENDLS